MIYIYPEKWTEEKFDILSDEDDRFEWKLGRAFTQSDENNFRKKLAQELGAFANSFGGTLFVGVTDDKQIVGVPKIWRGRQSTKEWLENIIPTLFELRLHHFRVSKMELTQTTQDKIGDDNLVLAIDVLDSELAPHQCVFNKKYYYRISSKSEPAPHHYLAYLWGRTSPNMSNVVGSWFRFYLNHFIDLLETTADDFGSRKFNTIDFPLGSSQIYVRRFIFFQLENWKVFNSSLTAKQFLRTYPEFDLKRIEFTTLIENFYECFSELEIIVDKAPEFERRIRELFVKVMQMERITHIDNFKEKPFEEILRLYAGQVFEREVSGISNHPIELKEVLVRMTVYNLLNLELDANSRYTIFFNFCREQITNQFVESHETINTKIKEIFNVMDRISKTAKTLFEEADELRYALALKHNTTYE